MADDLCLLCYRHTGAGGVSRHLRGYSPKDEVLLATFQRNRWWFLARSRAFLTAFYMTRQIFMVFFGNGAVAVPRSIRTASTPNPRSL